MDAYFDDERHGAATHIAGVPSGCGGRERLLCRSSSTYPTDTPSSSLLAFAARALATPPARPTGTGS